MMNSTTAYTTTTLHPGDESFFHLPEDNPLLLRTSDYIPIPDNQAEIDTISDGFKHFMLVFDFLSSIIGIFGNVLTIVAIVASKKLQTANNFFVAHLAAVDLLICGVVLPVNMASMISGNGHVYHCSVYGPLIIGVMILSLLSLANIALNRYFLVCKDPHLYAKIYSKKSIGLIMLACYVYTGLLLIPPYVGLSQWAEHVKYKACLYAAYDVNGYIYGIGLLSLSAFVPPAAVCFFSYYSIIKKFRESRAKFSKVAPRTQTSAVDDDATSTVIEDDEVTTTSVGKKAMSRAKSSLNLVKKAEASKTDSKTFKTVIGMILVFVVFILCWTPVVIVNLIDVYGRLKAEIYVFLIGVAWLNSSVNIFMYAALNSNFRHAYKLIMTCKWKQLRSG